MQRYYDKEIMDDFSISDERIDNALIELQIINNFLGGSLITANALKNFNNITSVLDIGAGSSDILKKSQNNFLIFAVDKNLRACKYNLNNNNIPVINADALMLPFKKSLFDLIHVSLFLHHFKEDELSKMLKEFSLIAKRGIIINDLRRSALAYIGIKILTILFSKSKMVKNDGPLSVKKGFYKKEIVAILNNCGFNNFIIKRKWAFRWMVIIYL